MNNQPIRSLLLRSVVTAGISIGSLLAVPNPAIQAPDNTAANKRDTSANAPTADQAKNNLSDRQMTAHIRRDIVKDKSLSGYAHNVKIVADHGKVTLKGPVRSEEEKKAVEDYARKYAGEGNVSSELTVKGS